MLVNIMGLKMKDTTVTSVGMGIASIGVLLLFNPPTANIGAMGLFLGLFLFLKYA